LVILLPFLFDLNHISKHNCDRHQQNTKGTIMSSVLTSQINTTETNSKLKETLTEIAAIAAMFAVTSTLVLVMSLSWVN